MEFTIYPKFSTFESFAEFAKSFEFLSTDFLLTNEFIFDPFIKALDIPCKVLFQEKFGTGEPTDEMIDAIRRDLPDDTSRIIAVGGGTIIDIAKVLIFSGDFSAEQLFMGEIVPEKKRQLIAIPTTCGTGSEATNLTIAELKTLQSKRGLGLMSMYPDLSVLIPEMVTTLPYKFFATSSIDALVHAVESMVSPKSTPHSEVFAEKAIRLIVRGFQQVVKKGQSSWTDYAGDFLFASNYAGIAFGSAGVGAVHALSYPLGGSYHIPHGEANQLMFMGVFKMYKKKQPRGRINRVEEILADLFKVPMDETFDALDGIMQGVLKRQPLRQYGIQEEDLERFSRSVIEGQQRLLANNYVELTEQEILLIYEGCF